MATDQYLTDPESGESMAPERNESIDRRLEDYLKAKDKVAECQNIMQTAKEEIIAIAQDAGIDVYRYPFRDKVFTAELFTETRLSIQAAKIKD